MSKYLYKIVLLPLSRLSMDRLYRLSGIVYFLLYHVIRYRRGVVKKQVQNSFPGRSKSELKDYEKGFYRHLSDLILEVVRGFSISKEEVIARGRVLNPEIFDDFFKKGRNLIIVGGHYNNWEMLTLSLASQIPYDVYGIYKPLRDQYLNEKIKESRGRFGMGLLTKAQFKKFLCKPTKAPFAIIFGADQSPTYSKNVYWMEFLNQKTPVAFGTEHYAKANDLAVLYGKIEKAGRGFYELTFSVITDEPTETPYGFITESHTKLLEKSIVQDPRNWIWTHKRWKRR